jgi:hypothetical protein
MESVLNFVTGLSVVLIALVLISVRRAHIRVEYSVSWLGASLTLLLISRSSLVRLRLAELLGITDAPLALVLIIGCLFLLVLYRVSVTVSELKDGNIALAQRVAILEYQIRSSHEEQEAKASR